MVFVMWYSGPILKGICLCRICFYSKGIPQPNITWLKKGGSLSDSISLLFNGSLLLQNVSLENEGTYVCTAINALGKAKATSVLHLLGKCQTLVRQVLPVVCTEYDLVSLILELRSKQVDI